MKEPKIAPVNYAIINSLWYIRFSIPITRSVMICLKPGAWLNDEVIHFTMHMLEERDGKCVRTLVIIFCLTRSFIFNAALLCIQNENRKQSHFFNAYFMQSLLTTDGKYNYENIKRFLITDIRHFLIFVTFLFLIFLVGLMDSTYFP